METTTIILIIAICAIAFMIYLRFYKKVDDSIKTEARQKKEDVYYSPTSEDTINNEKENKEYDMPEEETTMIITEDEIEEENKEYDTPDEEITRFIPDEEIAQKSDEHEKEIIRINNYFILDGIKNLTGTDFFNLQENIILDSNSDHADLYTDIHQIFQISEKRFLAITDLPDEKMQGKEEKEKTLKGILGIIECRNNFGHGRLELNKGRKEEELNTDWYSPVKEIIIGKHLLQIKTNNDLAAFEPLCHEIEKLDKDYVVYISGNFVYIRIYRPASLVDIKTMMDILTNFQQ